MGAREQADGSDRCNDVSGRSWMPFALALPALLLLVAVVGYPLLTIVLRSLSEPQWGLQNYVWFFGTPVNLVVLQRTFFISAWVTVVCVICAYPYAYMMTAVGPEDATGHGPLRADPVLDQRRGAHAVLGHLAPGFRRHQFDPAGPWASARFG